MYPFGEFHEKYKGFVPPLGKLDFFLSIGQNKRTSNRTAILYRTWRVRFSFVGNSDEFSGEVITVMRPINIFFMGGKEDYESGREDKMLGVSYEYNVGDIQLYLSSININITVKLM